MVSMLWILLLTLWIWVLQSRVGRLEAKLRELAEKKSESTAVKEPPMTAPEPERTEERCTHTPEPSSQELAAERARTEGAQKTRKVPSGSSIGPDSTWIVALLRGWFGGGNLPVRLGGVVLFFGLAFLLKYAASHLHVGIEVRLLAVAALGTALIGLGWRLRKREGAYGQVLQGVGVAVLYLTVYAATKLYVLLSVGTAFALMILIVILGVGLALGQGSLPLALFSTVGGYLAPLLVTSGGGSRLLLFGYYLLLNSAVLVIAWRKNWRALNLAGFLFTFVIATLWGVFRYRPELFATTEPFLLLFFLQYVVVTILFAFRSEDSFVDPVLLFGVPAATFPLQLHLVALWHYGAGLSAVGFGLFYLGLYALLRRREGVGLLRQGFLGLGILFLTLSIPYFFEARITAAIWSSEAAASLWLSLRQSQTRGRYFAEGLLLLSGLLYALSAAFRELDFASGLGYLLVAAALFGSGLLLSRYRRGEWPDSILAELLGLLSFMVWMLLVLRLSEALEPFALTHKITIGFVLGTMLYALAGRLSGWKEVEIALQLTLPIGGALYLDALWGGGTFDPFAGLGAVAFAMLWLWQGFLLDRYGRIWFFARVLHLLWLWFGVGVLALALYARVVDAQAPEVLRFLALGAVPLLSVSALLFIDLFRGSWRPYTGLYRRVGAGALVLFLFGWNLWGLSLSADGWEGPYLPILNPLDGMQIAAAWLGYLWSSRYASGGFWQRLEALGVLALITAIFARAVHHYEGVAYTLEALWHSPYFQAAVSIGWSLIALSLMLLGGRRGDRGSWMGGFALLLVVVGKLFLVDMAHSGTVERIISFLVVGLLLLLVGYLVPLPPQKSPNREKEGESEE